MTRTAPILPGIHGRRLFQDIHEQTVIVLPHALAELRARHVRTVVFVAPTGPVAAPRTPRALARCATFLVADALGKWALPRYRASES